MSGFGNECAAIVRAARAGSYRVGMVLGSGLGTLADEIEDAIRVPYTSMPGFPIPTVSSHLSELVAGKLGGQDVVVLSGRAHYYEQGDAGVMRTPVETLQALGCDLLILTNAAGSLRKEVGPGSAMLINDHINLSGANPLIGEESDKRFVDLTNAYDPELRSRLKAAAEKNNLDLPEGVYSWWSGPSFETPAEIRMARTMGADAAGMSTVPEVIIARFLGLRVAALSSITNLAAGMQAEVSHDETKEMGLKTVGKLKTILKQFLSDLDERA